jgi:hypothetical protein
VALEIAAAGDSSRVPSNLDTCTCHAVWILRMTFTEIARRLFPSLVGAVPRPTLQPGPTRIADGRTPSDPELRRLPLLVWGDAFPSGDRPQVRRVLAGADAHECMYAWVYLNEQLAVREMADAARRQAYTPLCSLDELRVRFQALKSAATDPQSQISDELLDTFMPAAMFLTAAGADNAEFCELGSTFLASIEKLDLCSRILGTPLERAKVLFSGIEYSPFLRRSSTYFHPHDMVRLSITPDEWQRTRESVFHISRFVGSYAFRSTESFASELSRSDAFHIIDVFNLETADFHSWDLGLPITFFNFPALIDTLMDSGFELFLTRVDPEFHAAGQRRALVGRLFGIRREAAARLRYYERFESLGGFAAALSARPLARGDGEKILDEVDASLTPGQWEALAEYKKFFPIWGRSSVNSREEVAQIVSSDDLEIDLTFDTGQASAVARHALQQNNWDPR